MVSSAKIKTAKTGMMSSIVLYFMITNICLPKPTKDDSGFDRA
jgi:hypothetical protein